MALAVETYPGDRIASDPFGSDAGTTPSAWSALCCWIITGAQGLREESISICSARKLWPTSIRIASPYLPGRADHR